MCVEQGVVGNGSGRKAQTEVCSEICLHDLFLSSLAG